MGNKSNKKRRNKEETNPSEKSFGDLFSEELKKSFIKAFNINHMKLKDALLKYCSTRVKSTRLTKEEKDVFNYIEKGFCSFEKDNIFLGNPRRFWKGFTISFFKEEDKAITDLLAAMGFLSGGVSSLRDLSKLNIADILRNGVSNLFIKTELEKLDLWAISSVDFEPYRFRSISGYIVLLSILYDFNTNEILRKRYGEVLRNELSVSSKVILGTENKRHGHNLRKRSCPGKGTKPVGNKSNKKRRNKEEPISVRSPVNFSMNEQVDNKVSINENAEKQPVLKVEKDDDPFDFYGDLFAREGALLDAYLYYKNYEQFFFPWEVGYGIELF